jgi:hypothetical protein
MFLDEYQYLTEVIMPFLRKSWEEIDLAESASGEPDGRLTKDEWASARDRAIARGDFDAANILAELAFRYDAICEAHVDSGGSGRETQAGISRADVSVYAQLWNPEYPAAKENRCQKNG